MTDSSAVACADASLRAAVRRWAEAAGGEAWSEAGVEVASAGGPIRSFNNAFVTSESADVSAALSRVRSYFDCHALPYRLRIREDLAGAFDHALTAAGFARHGGIPCLVLSPLPDARAGALLPVRRVADAQTLRDHVDVVAAAFDWDGQLLGRVFTTELVEDDTWRAYVGYADGRPVASSQLLTTDGVAGVYYVATLPQHRRRGFGEALTRHALNEGSAAGCDLASLQASPMGLPIYERMGFQQVSYYRTYLQQEA